MPIWEAIVSKRNDNGLGPAVTTHAAQAIAARSFACSEHAQFGHRHYELTNTASSQVYVGSVKHHRAVEAVAMTRGTVLSYDGLLVPGSYSSCCGGGAQPGVHPRTSQRTWAARRSDRR